VFFLGSASIADPDEQGDWNLPLLRFSQLIVPLMVLRYIFRTVCWQPTAPRATIMVDDPPLWQNYGRLNFDRLLDLTDRHDFHASIAFIPHNYRRTHSAVVRLFRSRPDRLSLCFHGNDHTRHELATNDPGLTDAIVRSARKRMAILERNLGLPVDRIMTFPHGVFSAQAMESLTAHGFDAAVNSTANPAGVVSRARASELILPAILRRGHPPLFARREADASPQEIACGIFCGQPIILGGHHEMFGQPQWLIDVVERVKGLSPGIAWTGVRRNLSQAYLHRVVGEDEQAVFAFSKCAELYNQSEHDLAYGVTLPGRGERKLTVDGQPWDGGAVRVASRARRVISLAPESASSGSGAALGLAWRTKSYVRRRLSEIRDNYVTPHPTLFRVTDAIKTRIARS
jgi:hypothetical protein